MTEHLHHDFTLSTGFKTPILIERYFVVNDQTDSSLFPDQIAKHNPHIIGDATNYLFVSESLKSAITYSGNRVSIVSDYDTHAIIRSEAGKNWHEFVMEMLNMHLYGIENLALIPGTIGAAPVQNIGAYGKEVSDTILSVHCLNVSTGEKYVFSKDECQFSYRSSIFKKHDYSNLLITHVDFILSKVQSPKADYPDVETFFIEKEITNPSSHDIAEAIIAIRRIKLPDPQIIGNAGSFFKNPVISIETFQSLLLDYPTLPSYPVDDLNVKIPAGWLIDNSGYKGFRYKGAGVHDKQALVLINSHNATGRDIYELSLLIQHNIHQRFGIMLEPEVNILL